VANDYRQITLINHSLNLRLGVLRLLQAFLRWRRTHQLDQDLQQDEEDDNADAENGQLERNVCHEYHGKPNGDCQESPPLKLIKNTALLSEEDSET
jgi:hypothetical protein